MKVSETVLQAIFIGMTAGAVTSCGLNDTITEFDENHKVVQVTKGGEDGGTCTITPDNCPACGLG